MQLSTTRYALTVGAAALIGAASALAVGLAVPALRHGTAAVESGRPPIPAHDSPAFRQLAATFPTKSTELQFVALNQVCRIVTTATSHTTIGANRGTRTFQVTGVNGFPAQGGASGGCGVPETAVSVATSVTAQVPAAAGAIVAYPAGTTVGAGRTISLAPGADQTGFSTVRIGTGGRITVLNSSTRAVNLLIDLTGYYVPQIQGLIYTGSTPSIYSGSPRILSVTHVSPGVADVTIDRDVSLCTAVVTSFYDRYYYANAKNQGTNQIRIYSWYLSSTTSTTTPLYIDNYVYLAVHC